MAIDGEFTIVPEAVLRLLKSAFSASQLESIGTPELASLVLRLSDLVSIYNSQLEYLHRDPQAFLRAIQSPRIHHSLFIRNTLIFQTCTSILEHISSVHRSRSSKPSTGSGKLIKTTNKLSHVSLTPGIDFTLEDPAAAQFWLKNWPSDVRLPSISSSCETDSSTPHDLANNFIAGFLGSLAHFPSCTSY